MVLFSSCRNRAGFLSKMKYVSVKKGEGCPQVLKHELLQSAVCSVEPASLTCGFVYGSIRVKRRENDDDDDDQEKKERRGRVKRRGRRNIKCSCSSQPARRIE